MNRAWEGKNPMARCEGNIRMMHCDFYKIIVLAIGLSFGTTASLQAQSGAQTVPATDETAPPETTTPPETKEEQVTTYDQVTTHTETTMQTETVISGKMTPLSTDLSAFRYDWEGPYGGIFLGSGFFDVQASDFNDTFTNDAPSTSAVVPILGVNYGYNWTPWSSNFLIGFEFDIHMGNEVNKLVKFNQAGTDGQLYENKIDNIVSLRGRAGVINDNVLTYFTAGPARASVNYGITSLDPAISNPTCMTAGIICAQLNKDKLTGMALGAGIEYALRENRTIRFEIIHFMLPTASSEILNGGQTPVCSTAQADDCSVFFESSTTQFKFGMNFKF